MSGHKLRDFPTVKVQDTGSFQFQASASNDAPKKNRFYALLSKCEKETYPNVVIGMLKFFSIYVLALLDVGATLSSVTSLVSKQLVIFPDILNEPFILCTLVGGSVVPERVYRYCTIMLHNRVTHVELVELYMFDFDVILGMDWLHAYKL